MGFGSSPLIDVVAYGRANQGVGVPVYFMRSPTVNDYNYPIGQRWFNRKIGGMFILASVTNVNFSKSANWSSFASQFYVAAAAKVVLVGGTLTVDNAACTSQSLVFVTKNVEGGTPGMVYAHTIQNGSFVLTSTNAGDTSTYLYNIINEVL